MRAKDPEKRSRLENAAAFSALCSAFFGGLIFFESGMPYNLAEAEKRMIFAATGIMVMFWFFFLPLYFGTVHKSRKIVEIEHRARQEERRKVARTKAALKPRGD